MSSPKVLMLLDNPLKSDSRVEKEAASLLAAGYEVSIWTETSGDLPGDEVRNGFSIRRILPPVFKSPLRRKYRQNVLAVAQAITEGGFDFVHCHDYQMLPYGTAARRMAPRLRLMYDSHEYLPGWPLYQTSRGLLNKIKGYLTWKKALRQEREGANRADAMFVVSQRLADLYQKVHRLSRLPVVVSNFPNEIAWSELADHGHFHRRYRLAPDKLIVVHSGNIYQSNHEMAALIDGISRLPELVMVFLGDTPRFKELEARLSHQPNVFFDGFGSQGENIQRMASADIGICHINSDWASQRFTVANRYMEYTYAGLAVLCNEYEGVHHITDRFPNTAYYWGLGQGGNFMAKLREALENRQVLRAQSLLARPHFSFELEAKKLIAAYEGLLS